VLINQTKGENMAKECQYCQLWSDIPPKLRIIERIGEKKISRRKCTFTKDFVYRENEGCVHYIPGTYFWCDKQHERIHQKICIHRARNKIYDCTERCPQYKCILSGLRGYRQPIENGLIAPIRRRT